MENLQAKRCVAKGCQSSSDIRSSVCRCTTLRVSCICSYEATALHDVNTSLMLMFCRSDFFCQYLRAAIGLQSLTCGARSNSCEASETSRMKQIEN